MQQFFLRFSAAEQVLFAKRLAFLMRGGVPILECLTIIRAQTRGKKKIALLDALMGEVANGTALSQSLERYKRLFGDFAINIIRVGERSGTLSNSLNYLADELSKKQALRHKVLGALMYPAFITFATLGVVGLVTAFIFPKLMPIFTSLHVELPLTTRLLIATSSFLRAWWWTLFLGAGALAALWFFLRMKFRRMRYVGDRILLLLPIAGKIAQAYNLANFCRTLGVLLSSGEYVVESLRLAADTTHNAVYAQAARRLGRAASRGELLSTQLLREGSLYPEMLSHMLMVGEKTGSLASTCLYLGGLYENELEERTRMLSGTIEPLLMVIMGLLVGLIAVSVITPIYAVTQHLQTT